MRKLLVLSLLVGCALPAGEHTDYEQASYEAVAAAWEAAELPEPSDNCRLDLFKVRYASSPEETERLCGAPSRKVYGCTYRESYGRPFHKYEVPVIVFADWYRPEPLDAPELLVHELLHSFNACTFGSGDPGHVAAHLWASIGGDESVQALAIKQLREEGWRR